MSLTLLKKSMEILEEDIANKAAEKTKARAKEKRKQMSFVNKKSNRSTAKSDQAVKIKDIREEMKRDEKKSKENLKRLLALSKNTLKETDAKKFVKRAHKGRYEDIELPKREVDSIFTEADFRAFEEEYFKS